MWKGAHTIGQGGMMYGVLAFNPVVFLGSQLVKDFSERQPMKNTEKRQIVQFAKSPEVMLLIFAKLILELLSLIACLKNRFRRTFSR